MTSRAVYWLLMTNTSNNVALNNNEPAKPECTSAHFKAFNKGIKNVNPCLHDGITITPTGDVVPCTEMRKVVLGNIRKKSLQKILQQKNLSSLWYLTKDDIQTCRVWEFRYACFDCRAIDIETEGLYKRVQEVCTYNPHRGMWGD
jgi:radical SAM protein with 4Fe4S-binding SPASM domain